MPWSRPLPSPTGPAVARLFHATLAIIFLIAWSSLGVQVLVLIGERGLQPIAATLDKAGGRYGLWEFPTHLWVLGRSDTGLVLGCWLGGALALLAGLGIRYRECFFLTTALYLSYAVACRSFLAFQWDSMLVECGLLACLLSQRRASPIAHWMFRLLLFKLFFESGLAKIQSPAEDWLDGSAMVAYYQTAPLPTPLAFYAHYLPRSWHHFESWWTLFFETCVPFAVFGGRRLRRVAAVIFLLFFVVDQATANYGFFVPLSACLLVFLMDEAWAERLLARLKLSRTALPERDGLARSGLAIFAFFWIGISTVTAVHHFTAARPLPDLVEAAARFRFANVYHLFRGITVERVEPEIQTWDGAVWTGHDLRYKPGDVHRAPPFVAPHQPRVDFRLWFYGLDPDNTPSYVATLLARVCSDPAAVQELFAAPLPEAPLATRVVFWDTWFATQEAHAADGSWWRRSERTRTAAMLCKDQAQN